MLLSVWSIVLLPCLPCFLSTHIVLFTLIHIYF
jgi:hypothetical protein